MRDQEAVVTLNSLESRQLVDGRVGKWIRIGAWNVERCKNVEMTAKLIADNELDVAFLTEMDLGMARSGNVHTTKAIADLLGMNYVFGVEFIEKGHGNQTEIEVFKGHDNSHGHHGNALISRYLFHNHRILRLSGGEIWSGLDWHSDRVGSRIAIFSELGVEHSLIVFGCLHLESLGDPTIRQNQAEEILLFLNEVYPQAPIILAGDFNCSELPPGTQERSGAPDWFFSPWDYEPMFLSFRRSGFEWIESNTAEHTRRALANGWPRLPFKKLDWILTRGLTARRPSVIKAVDSLGAPISDHELITVEIAVPA